MRLGGEQSKDFREFLLAGEAHNSIETVALEIRELLSYETYAIGIMTCVADGIRLAREDLPASCEARRCCSGLKTLTECTTRDGEWCVLGEEVGSSAYSNDVVTLVVAKEVYIQLIAALIASLAPLSAAFPQPC